jgi:hypothetical protein
MIFKKERDSIEQAPEKESLILRLVVGLLAGTVVSLSGLGGGIVMVPLFRMVLQLPIKKATSLSLSVVPLLSIFPILQYWNTANAPILQQAVLPALNSLDLYQTQYLVGWFYLPMAIGVVIFSSLFISFIVNFIVRVPPEGVFLTIVNIIFLNIWSILIISIIIENIEIFNPATAEQVSEITSVLAHGTAPAYLRIGSLEELKPKAIGEIADFGEILYFGTSGSILVTGPLVTEAVEARKILAEQGHDLGIISVFNLSRFRLAEIQKVCPGPYVSVEEHRIKGGFNSMVLEEANFLRNGVGISGVGIQHFEHSKIGNRNYMLEKYGVTAINIVNAFNLLLD